MATASGTSYTITAREVVTRALRMLNAFASGSGPDSSQMREALIILNAVVRELDSRRAWPWASVLSNVTSVASQSAYTSSDGLPADIFKLEHVYYVDASDNRTPIDIVSFSEWAAIQEHTETGTPEKCYLTQELDQSTRTLHLWPAPNTASETIEVRYQQRIFNFEKDSDTPAFPAEWYGALSHVLAGEMAEEYVQDGNKISRIVARANEKVEMITAKAQPRTTNVKMERMYY